MLSFAQELAEAEVEPHGFFEAQCDVDRPRPGFFPRRAEMIHRRRAEGLLRFDFVGH